MKFESDPLTNEIISLSLSAKTLADQIDELGQKKKICFQKQATENYQMLIRKLGSYPSF